VNPSVSDFEGKPLSMGDSVVFISAPNTLQKGIVTGFKQLSKILTVVEIVVTLDNGTSHSLTAAPFVCARLS
jgi:hypothetical protein